MSIKSKQWLWILAAIVALVGVLMYSAGSIKEESSKKMPPKPTSNVFTDVSVMTVQRSTHRASLLLYGEAKSHYELVLNSQVSGEIIAVSPQFEVGERVSKDQTLLKVDATTYQAALATAQTSLADATLNYKEEIQESKRAQQEWNKSGFKGKPDELLLRKPQLKAAKAAMHQANTEISEAKRNLELTTIKAPFDAVIVTRDVALGQIVQSSTQIGTLHSLDRLEITVPLSEHEWATLPTLQVMQEKDFNVTVINTSNKERYTGYIMRQEGALDTTTRQRALIIGVNNPFIFSVPLFPGSFLSVLIEGEEISGLWKLPSSSLSQSGEIWYVDENNTLAHFSTVPLFTDQDSIYIKPPKSLDSVTRVLIKPLGSYLDAMQVNPIEVSQNVSK